MGWKRSADADAQCKRALSVRTNLSEMSGFFAGGCRPILLTCCWYVFLDVCLLLGRPCAAISATVIC